MGAGRERSRGGAPATKLAAYLAVAQAHAQWLSPDLKPTIEARQSSFADGVDGAISAWVAAGRNCILGQELTPEGEGVRADLVEASKLRELGAGEKFDVLSPREACEVQKQIAQTRRVPKGKWRMGRSVLKRAW